MISISSAIDENAGVANLVDGDDSTFWHVMFPTQEKEQWIRISLPVPENVIALGVLPRLDVQDQFWQSGSAEFQISNNGENWRAIAKLGSRNRTDKVTHFQYYIVQLDEFYKHYRILVKDKSFLSMGEISLYAASPD